MSEKTKTSPFLKWAGGKRKLTVFMNFPEKIGTYYEPFLGGGAVLFHFKPESAFISDKNRELVNTYHVLKYAIDPLIDELKKQHATKEYYYKIRNLDRCLESFELLSEIERAARFIYLNKMCFNGLYRVNKKNHFNVPFGDKKEFLVDEDNLKSVSDYLGSSVIEIFSGDFEEALDYPDDDDFVYLDPPYVPLSTSSFTGYTNTGFTLDDHYRLKTTCDSMNDS